MDFLLVSSDSSSICDIQGADANADADADANADADADCWLLIADHLDQEAGGRAPRQLCCIAVTAKQK